jgi:hypothetical protein
VRPSDRKRLFDQEAIRSASRFVVSTFIGRAPGEFGAVSHSSLFHRREFGSLAEARACRDALGHTDRYGRRAMIYAITREGYNVHVE